MPVELKVPTAGESIKEVQIGQWLKQAGEHVERDQVVVTIETDKATLELCAPVSGTIAQVLRQPGEKAGVGEVIALIEEGPAAEPATAVAQASSLHPSSSLAGQPVPQETPVPPGHAGNLKPETGNLKPVVVRMSPIRLRIAERLVQAKSAAALLTTFNEVDMSAVIALRQKHKDTFQERHKAKLGFMSFLVKAVVDALRLVPQVNAEISGEDILYYKHYDIGIAVSGGKGLVVPVLRNAERMSFAEIERAIAGFAQRAAENKIGLEELQGGTFTITNGGVFGSLLSTPIVNPPQSGILGMHVIQERPVARDGQVVIRPMMYVALTYDHRLIDGREAVTFLKRIKECIEEPSLLLLGM